MKSIYGRIGGLAVAVCGLALALPGTAAATGSHHIIKYKVEKHVTLNGDFEQVDLACESGDYALDGMWRLDHVDQDNDYVGNVLQSLNVYDSYGDGANPALWHFSFSKDQPGDAQLKVFLTCLGKKTAPNTHQHEWTVSPQQYVGNHPVGGGTPLVPAYTDITTLQGTSTPVNCPAYDTANSVKSILIAPGFHVNENADPLRLVGSYPGAPAGTGDIKRNWSWQFEARGAGSGVDVLWRCLQIKSTKYPTVGSPQHRHRLVTMVKFVGNLPLPTGLPGTSGKATEVQAHCGDLYKALVGGFWLGNLFRDHVWFLGMDPRPKTRAFRLLNMGPGATVDTAIHCFNDRTT